VRHQGYTWHQRWGRPSTLHTHGELPGEFPASETGRLHQLHMSTSPEMMALLVCSGSAYTIIVLWSSINGELLRWKQCAPSSYCYRDTYAHDYILHRTLAILTRLGGSVAKHKNCNKIKKNPILYVTSDLASSCITEKTASSDWVTSKSTDRRSHNNNNKRTSKPTFTIIIASSDNINECRLAVIHNRLHNGKSTS